MRRRIHGYEGMDWDGIHWGVHVFFWCCLEIVREGVVFDVGGLSFCFTMAMFSGCGNDMSSGLLL